MGDILLSGGSSSGGGGGAVTVADGADVTQGAIADAAVVSDANGTVSGKLRGLVKILSSVWDSINGRLKVDGSGVTQPVSGTVTATGTITANQGGAPWTIANNPGDAFVSAIADTDGNPVGVTDNALDVHIKQEDAVSIADSNGQPLIAINGALPVTLSPPISTTTVTGILHAPSSTVSINTANAAVVVVSQTAGSVTQGTVSFQASPDGVNWSAIEGMGAKGTSTTTGQVTSFNFSVGAPSLTDSFIFNVAAFVGFRVLVNSDLGSEITLLLTASTACAAPTLIWGNVGLKGTQAIKIVDSSGFPGDTVKSGSTAAVAADTSLVVALSPNSPLPAGTNTLGSVTATGAALETGGNLATLVSLAQFQQQNLDMLRRIDASLRALVFLIAQDSTSKFDTDDILNSDPLTIN